MDLKMFLSTRNCQCCKQLDLRILIIFNTSNLLVIIVCTTYFSIQTSLHFPLALLLFVPFMILRISLNYFNKQNQVDFCCSEVLCFL